MAAVTIMSMRQLVFAALLFWPIGSAGAQAPAQPAASPAQIDRIVGPWELSNPAGDRKCDVTFKPERNGSGFGLAFGPGCAGIFPAVTTISAWSVTANGNIQWLDQAGAATFDFGETEVGIFEALRPGDPSVYFLTNRGLAGTALPTADEITGLWTLGQPRGRALCSLTFKPELAAGAGPLEQRFALDVAEGCERSVAALGLTSWRLERELLVIQGGATVLSFKRDPDGRWTKVPADNRPLVMSRD
ncbi:MAG: AprI/Inh family metalloprotease inhibitor [Rhizobiales bacterium]|nr:AprI/Inh family metalloprotease inhibitor [Hyphomicrobiales bacterium]